jgi:hypothetical protein
MAIIKQHKSVSTKANQEIKQLKLANANLLSALNQFANCNLNDENCASLVVASKRIRRIARIAIAKTETP